MWPEFWLAFALVAALLVVPGALVVRALGAPRTVAVAAAPLFSLVAYGVMGVLLAALSVPASTPLVALPPVAVAVALLVLVRLRPGRRSRPHSQIPSRAPGGGGARATADPEPGGAHEARTLALYVVAGLAVTTLMLVANLSSPDSFIQAWDNVAHFDMVRSMSQSHNWSTLAVTYYPGQMSAIDPVQSVPHYYPIGWHLIAVMLVDSLGVSVTCAANAVNSVACAVVYPMGCWLMLRRVLGREEPRAVALGALACLAFPSFPWNLIPRWTLYPNLFSLSLMPAVIAAFMALAARRASLRERLGAAAVFVVGGVALCFAQPNSVFSAAVFLAPWCGMRIREWRAQKGDSPRRAWLWVGAWAAFVVAVWAALLHMPFLKGVVEFYWLPIASLESCVEGVFGLSFAAGPPRYALRLLAIVGIVSACLRPRLRWLLVPFAFCCVAFVVAGGIDTPLKNIIAGFWYTDPYRMAAMAAMFCVPLAALGLFEVVRTAERLLAGRASAARSGDEPARLAGHAPARSAAARLVASVLVAAFAVGLYGSALLFRLGLPHPLKEDNFYPLAREFAQKNDAEQSLGYDAQKIAFVERALEVTGTDAVVLNMPYDGSAYAYGVSGMNVVYRYMSGYGATDEDQREAGWSRFLRTRLAAGLEGRDPLAEAALEELQPDYLLILDRDVDEMLEAFSPYVVADWMGILQVGDETPGLELVLSEGDMRLYQFV